MEQGWIKLHRKILENPIIKKANYLSLWIILLLKANHKDNKMIWNNSFIVIKEGQFITGREELARQSGIKPTTVERILKYLENGHQIEQQKTTKYRLITIVNWKEHQKVDSTSDNKRTTNGQQTDTNKNEKKDKNEKKLLAETSSAGEFILEEKLLDMEKVGNSPNDIVATFIREKPVSVENSKQLSGIIARYGRVAKLLSGAYTNEQIFEAVKKIKADNNYRVKKGQSPVDFTLETVYKQLTK